MSDEPPFEYQKWMHELERRNAERIHDRNDALVDNLNGAAITSGQAALRAALLINGGAAVAMLAFIGSLASGDRVDGPALQDIAAGLIWFAWGVAAAVIGMALAYLANLFGAAALMSHEKWWEHPYVRDGASTRCLGWTNGSFLVLAIVAGVTSIVLFVLGMVDIEASVGLLSPASD